MNEDGTAAWSLPALDADGSGAITISDVREWLLDVLFLPGDAALGAIMVYLPGVADFFELSPDDYGHLYSKIVSVIFWLLALLVAGLIVNAIRNLDRTLTAWIAHLWQDSLRQLRVVRRRLVSWVGLMRSRQQARRSRVAVGTVSLPSPAAAVLRRYGQVGEAQVVTAGDVAADLRLPSRQIDAAHRMLLELKLIRRGFGTDEGREGYQITQAGQIYLLER